MHLVKGRILSCLSPCTWLKGAYCHVYRHAPCQRAHIIMSIAMHLAKGRILSCLSPCTLLKGAYCHVYRHAPCQRAHIVMFIAMHLAKGRISLKAFLFFNCISNIHARQFRM
ncbi:MAG: hypothetical protein EZS28_006800 [Streblomastix strix]|uniref:Uncharacterized protein n=1 Tax=Streblomastix strix TaxID=222440 RepID=A0A5J4WT11_9EUKA|nr:MAG: hypothetical protein EZS28_006800 [Streblomastix strix]